MTQTRRLAAILAADVAGYSRLIGEDEAGTLGRLKAVRARVIDPAITEHRGRIVKTTGDAAPPHYVRQWRSEPPWRTAMTLLSSGSASISANGILVEFGSVVDAAHHPRLLFVLHGIGFTRSVSNKPPACRLRKLG